MTTRRLMTFAFVMAALSGGASAATQYIYLGQTSQDYVLYGQGAWSPGLGSFTNQQGDETSSGGVVTETLSGTIAGSTIAAYASGTYAFVTTFSGTPIGSGGAEIQSENQSSGGFTYSYLDPSLNMDLFLYPTGGGAKEIPIVTNGMFDGPGFSFSYTSAACGGAAVAVCNQNDVGLTPGATYSGPDTITISLTGTPEPAAWALMLIGAGLIGGALRSSRRGAAASRA